MTKNKTASKQKAKNIKIEFVRKKIKKLTEFEKINKNLKDLKQRYNGYKKSAEKNYSEDQNSVALANHEAIMSVLNELGVESLRRYLSSKQKNELIDALHTTMKEIIQLEPDAKKKEFMNSKFQKFQAELQKINKPHDKLSPSEIATLKETAEKVSKDFIDILQDSKSKAAEQRPSEITTLKETAEKASEDPTAIIQDNKNKAAEQNPNEQKANDIVNHVIRSIEDKGYKISKDQQQLLRESLIPRLTESLQHNNQKEIATRDIIVENLSNQIIDQNSAILKFFGRFSISESNLQKVSVSDNIFSDTKNTGTPPKTPERKSVKTFITKEDRAKAKEIIIKNKNKIIPPVSTRKSFSTNKDNTSVEKEKPIPPKRKRKEDHGM